MQKVKRTNRIVCGEILDILAHLGYEVEFNQHHQEEEIKLKTPVEYYIENIFDIMGDDVINKLSVEQINEIHQLSKKAKELEKENVTDED
jgi:L-serine deaminase